MADLTKTISNTVNFFGGSPSSLWNAYNWNAFKYGEGTKSLIKLFDKQISNSLVPDSALSQKDFVKVVENTLSPVSEMASESLKDSAGYNYVFVSDTTDNETRDIASYTSGSLQSTSWSSASAGSTTWS